MESLPVDIIASIFDHIPTKKEARGAANSCKALNDAWYESKHLESVTIPATVDIDHALSKADWKSKSVSLCVSMKSEKTVARSLRRLGGLETLDVLLTNPMSVDASCIVDGLVYATQLRTLRIAANSRWRIGPDMKKLEGLEHLSVMRKDGLTYASHLPRTLKTLEMVECYDSLIANAPLPALEFLALVDVPNVTRIRVDRYPSLQCIRLYCSTVVLEFETGLVRVAPTFEHLDFVENFGTSDVIEGGFGDPHPVFVERGTSTTIRGADRALSTIAFDQRKWIDIFIDV